MKRMFLRLPAILFSTLLLCSLLFGCKHKEEPPPAPAFNVEEQLSKAETLFRQGNYEETILALSAVIEVEPADARGYLRLSDAYHARGEKDKALELLKKGLDLTGDEQIAQRIQGMTQVVDGIVDVAGGEGHALLLNDKGEVYWCGNLVRRINNIRYSDYALTPKKVDGLSDVRSIGVGHRGITRGSFDFAITNSNVLYLWGELCRRYFEITQNQIFPTEFMRDVWSAEGTDNNLYIIKTDGMLYALGDNSDGQRGSGEKYVEEYHAGSFAWDKNMHKEQAVRVMDGVQKIVGGAAIYTTCLVDNFAGKIAFALDEEGTLFGWGTFGVREEGGRIVKTCFNIPRELKQDINDMDADYESLYVITREGKLLYATLESVGSGAPDWVEIDCGGVPMQSVCCGNGHYIAVNVLGEVLCGGSNYVGQMGRPVEETRNVELDKPIRPLGESRVRLAIAGQRESYAVTPEGALLSWGNNDEGQLGNGRRGTQKNAEEPTFVMHSVEKVFASESSAYFLMENADLYLAGSGYWIKNVTAGETEEAYTPVKVMENVAMVNADSGGIVKTDHTLWLPGKGGYEKKMDDVIFHTSSIWTGDENHMVIRSDNSLWGWGDNHCGELGVGWLNDVGAIKSTPVTEPVKIMDNVSQVSFVSFPAEYNMGSAVYILTLNGKLYFCGYDIASSYGGDALEGPDKNVFQTMPKLVDKNVTFVFGHRGICSVFYIKQDGRMYSDGWGADDLFYSSNGYYSEEKASIRSGVSKANESILLDKDGGCYMFGGQVMVRLLGLDPDAWAEKAKAYGEGQLICELMLEDVKDVACSWGAGDISYYAVKTNGDLYAWGKNLKGQLGLGEAGAQENIYEVELP